MVRKGSVGVVASCLVALVLCTGCGEEAVRTLWVEWGFEEGDCASNNIETVRVDWGPPGNLSQREFACGDGSGELGPLNNLREVEILSEGIDDQGIVRMESDLLVNFHGPGAGTRPIGITLRPRPGGLLVTWQMATGGGCPSGVILPYHIALYHAPETPGDSLTDRVLQVQESCQTGAVTLPPVAPGRYVVELDSRAQSPAVYATREVEVVAGDEAEVAFEF